MSQIRLELFNAQKQTKLKKNIQNRILNFSSFAFNLKFFLQTESALIYDAVDLFARALDNLDRSREVNIDNLDCLGDRSWKHGSSLIKYMKWVSFCLCNIHT